jgi:hypothetical protein
VLPLPWALAACATLIALMVAGARLWRHRPKPLVPDYLRVRSAAGAA